MRTLLCFVIAICSALALRAQVAEVRTYGGLYFDEGRDVCEWGDGYALVGTTASVDGGNSDFVLYQLTDDLDISWTRILGNTNSEQCRAVLALPEGDLLVYGQTANGEIGGYDLVVFRVTQAGELVWRKEYGTPDWDLASDITYGNSTVFLSATTYGSSPGGSRMMVLRINEQGELLDENTYDILPDAEAMGMSFYGGFNYLSGTRTFEGQHSQAVVRKLTPSGAIVWEQVRDSVAFMGNSVHATEFGIAAGFTVSDQTEDGNWDLLLIGFDHDGNELWNRWDNPPDPGLEICKDIVWYEQNVILTASLSGIYGSGGDGAKVLRNDAGGFFIGSTVFGGERDEEPYRLIKDSQGRLILVGRSDSFGNGNDDIYLIRLPDQQVSSDYTIDFADFTEDGIFVGIEDRNELRPLAGPNPVSEALYLPAQASWRLIASDGNAIAEGFSRNIHMGLYPSGVYLLQWEYRGQPLYQRIVKQ